MSSSHDDQEHRDAGLRRNAAADVRLDVLLRRSPPRRRREPALAELFSDEAIDRILRDVPCRMTVMPPLAAGRGRRVPLDLEAVSSGLDRQVVVPSTPSALRSSRLARSAVRAGRDALKVAAMLSVVVAMFGVSVLASRWLSEPMIRGVVKRPHGLDFSSVTPGGGDSIVMVLPGERPAAVHAAPAGDEGRSGASVADPATVADDSSTSRFGPAHVGEHQDDHVASVGENDFIRQDGFTVENGGLPDSSPAAAATELRAAPVPGPAAGVQGVFAGGKAARMPGESLRVIPSRPSVDRSVTYHRGYDLAFEMTHGEAPFIDPALSPALAMDRPPLSRRTDSFDRVEHLMAAGGLRRDRLRQAIAGLRVEEALAALPAAAVETPAAAGAAVRLVGLPSLSGRPTSRLLEVSVTAPASPPRSRPTGNLLFVLDGSAAAGADEAWPAVCRGVEHAIRRLDPAASVSVVVFAERPVVITLNAPARDMLDLRRRLAEIRPRGGGDLHGCLAMVRGELAKQAAAARCVVVAHAGSIARAERDGDPDLAAWRRSRQLAGDDDASGSAGSRVDGGIGSGLEVVAIDAVSGATDVATGRNGASLLDGVGLDSMAIRRSIAVAALREELPPVLAGCRLEVAFDPAQVAGYRLVGHRRQVVDMTSSRSSSVDLADGECVRAVYEVVLRERPSQGRSATAAAEAWVAKATLRYRRRGEAAESSVVGGIAASQLAVDPGIEDLSAQASWLAVALAELAAGSAHIESQQRLREVLRQRFERIGETVAGSSEDARAAETFSILRQLRGMWTLL